MSDAPRFRVPHAHVEPLQEFARLPKDAASRLVAALSADPPVTDRGALQRSVEKALPPSAIASLLLDALLSLEVVRTSHGWSVEQVASGVSSAPNLELTAAQRRRLEGRLASVLGLPSLSANAKALDLLTSHERMLHLSRIVTDVRPVFSEDPAGRPIGALISHALDLACFGPSGRVEDFYFGLDDNALAALGRAVERAQTKSKSLRELLADTGIPVIDVDVEEA